MLPFLSRYDKVWQGLLLAMHIEERFSLILRSGAMVGHTRAGPSLGARMAFKPPPNNSHATCMGGTGQGLGTYRVFVVSRLAANQWWVVVSGRLADHDQRYPR